MRYHVSAIASIFLAAGLHPISPASAADGAVVRFDLPPIAAARDATSDAGDPSLVTVELRLSSMIESARVPQIDQWIVRCQPRDSDVQIGDYAPRTETASGLSTPIQVKKTEEETNAFGLSLDGAYGHAIRGNVGSDHTNKNINTLQFDRVAPLQVVTAAGTINRGRGVYFKLRWTAEQVLEGEKTFHLTLRVPSTWRGSLLDVSVVAQSDRKSFGGLEHETRTNGSANFVVAVYREGDSAATELSQALADAEEALRSAAAEHSVLAEGNSLPKMLRRVAMKLDLESSQDDQGWLQRLLVERADPHLDKDIRQMPMPVRVAVLDYAEVRDKFVTMNENVVDCNANERVLVAKPAID